MKIGLKCNMTIYFFIFISFIYSNISIAKDKNLMNEFVIYNGKNKCFSEKKVLEIVNLNTEYLKIQRDFINNRICFKAVKEGQARVFILLSDGRRRIEMKISIVAKKQGYFHKKNKQNSIYKKFSTFDKDIKNNYVFEGWKE